MHNTTIHRQDSSFPLLNSLITALAPMIWGSTYIVTTELLPPDRPFIAALIRTLPAGILLILYSRQLPKAGQWWRLIILSALNIGLFQALLFVAAYRLPGGLAAVVGATQPLMVIGLARVIEGHKASSLTIFAAVVGVVGMLILLLSPYAVWDTVGILAATLGAISMALGTFLTKRWRGDMPILPFTGWQLAIGGLILSPVALMYEPALIQLTMTEVLGYSYLSLMGALFAYGIWFRGVAKLSPVAVSSLGLLSSLTAVVLGWIVLGQSMTLVSMLGFMLVVTSILTVQLARR